jgi:hypothetical protein
LQNVVFKNGSYEVLEEHRRFFIKSRRAICQHDIYMGFDELR